MGNNGFLLTKNWVYRRKDHVINEVDLNQNIGNNATSILLLYKNIDTRSNINFLKLLISQNVSYLEIIKPSGQTALHHAIYIMHGDAVRLILDHAITNFININVRNSTRLTPPQLFKQVRNRVLTCIQNSIDIGIEKLNEFDAVENIKKIEKSLVDQFKFMMSEQKQNRQDDIFANGKARGTALNDGSEQDRDSNDNLSN